MAGRRNDVDGPKKTATVAGMSKQEIYTLEIDAEAYQLLRAAKRKNESFSATIRRRFRERLPGGVTRIKDPKIVSGLAKSLEREREFGKIREIKNFRELLNAD